MYIVQLPEIIPNDISRYVVEVANDDRISPEENKMAPTIPHIFGP